MDIIERLESCLNAPAGSTTEEEAEKAIRSATRHIKALREAHWQSVQRAAYGMSL